MDWMDFPSNPHYLFFTIGNEQKHADRHIDLHIFNSDCQMIFGSIMSSYRPIVLGYHSELTTISRRLGVSTQKDLVCIVLTGETFWIPPFAAYTEAASLYGSRSSISYIVFLLS